MAVAQEAPRQLAADISKPDETDLHARPPCAKPDAAFGDSQMKIKG
jgi:hypothetical protein